jgi:hypothetical protein
MLEHEQYEAAMDLAEKIQHPVLWKLIAEHSLEKLDFKTAIQAYGKSKDYLHVQFVKWLQKMDVSDCHADLKDSTKTTRRSI